jgi:ATP-dependent Zn protease
LSKAYAKARELIELHKDLHIKISEKLIQTEEINKEEFDAFFA